MRVTNCGCIGLLVSLLLSKVCNCQTPAPTLSDLVVSLLSAQINDPDYELSNDPTEWNVTQIAHKINESDPTWLYSGLPTATLEAFLPDFIIEQLPLDVLVYRCLCDYVGSPYYTVNDTDYCYDECDTSSNSNSSDTSGISLTPVCEIYPLVYSKYDNPIAETESDNENVDLSDCGLACKAGTLVYGLSDTEQSLVDAFKVIGTTICFIAILFLFVNQILDQKFSNEKFWDKPLLHHCPYFISASVFSIMILMTLGEVIGKKSIVCNLDDTDESFSFYNPFRGSHNAGCIIQGLLFYSSLVYYMCYTLLLTFVIFRQFYHPLRPLWNIEKKWFHVGIAIFVVLIDSILLGTSNIDGIWPMGVCLPGPGEKTALLWFLSIPFILTSACTFGFLVSSMYLLNRSVKDQERATNSKIGIQTLQMRDLLKRMSIYGSGIVATLTLLAITSFVFYSEHDKLREGMQDQIACEIEYQWSIDAGLSPTYTCDDIDRTSLSPFWFISWIISCLSAVIAQLVLSCHVQSRERVQRQLTRVNTQLHKMGSQLHMENEKSQKSRSTNPEKSALHGAEGYRSGDGTIVGMNRRITDHDINNDPRPHVVATNTTSPSSPSTEMARLPVSSTNDDTTNTNENDNNDTRDVTTCTQLPNGRTQLEMVNSGSDVEN